MMARINKTLPFLPLLAGCYSYTPIAPAAAPAGAEVRARITGAASDRVAPLLGTLDTRELVGNVVENNAGQLVLEVPLGAAPNVTADVVTLRTRVPIGPSDVVSIETRKLDKVRTSMLAGAIVAGIGLGVAAAVHAGGGKAEGSTQSPDGPPVNRIPLLKFRF